MSLGIETGDFTQILNDQAVSVSGSTLMRTNDPIFGSPTDSYSDAPKTWIFFKRASNIQLKEFSIIDIGDAYLIMPVTDSFNFGDRVKFDGETFEYTNDCFTAKRYADGTALYQYFTLKKTA